MKDLKDLKDKLAERQKDCPELEDIPLYLDGILLTGIEAVEAMDRQTEAIDRQTAALVDAHADLRRVIANASLLPHVNESREAIIDDLVEAALQPERMPRQVEGEDG